MSKTTPRPTARKATAAESTAAESTAALTTVLGGLAESSRRTVAGVLEIDKALLGYARASLSSYVDHGKASLAAKNLNTLVDLQASFLHAMIETGAANTREVIDLTRTKAKEAYTPVQDALPALRREKSA